MYPIPHHQYQTFHPAKADNQSKEHCRVGFHQSAWTADLYGKGNRMSSSAQTKAVTKYIKTHMRQFVCRCNNEKDGDVIEYLEGCGNVNAEIKRLVREEIKRKNEAQPNQKAREAQSTKC